MKNSTVKFDMWGSVGRPQNSTINMSGSVQWSDSEFWNLSFFLCHAYSFEPHTKSISPVWDKIYATKIFYLCLNLNWLNLKNWVHHLYLNHIIWINNLKNYIWTLKCEDKFTFKTFTFRFTVKDIRVLSRRAGQAIEHRHTGLLGQSALQFMGRRIKCSGSIVYFYLLAFVVVYSWAHVEKHKSFLCCPLPQPVTQLIYLKCCPACVEIRHVTLLSRRANSLVAQQKGRARLFWSVDLIIKKKKKRKMCLLYLYIWM